MREALEKVPGVHSAEVIFADQEARVAYDAEKTSIADLVAAVEAAGYRAWDAASEKRGGERPAGEEPGSAGSEVPGGASGG